MNASLDWLTDPEVFQVNRLPAHSDHVCYASQEECDRGVSSLRQSLDGAWRFAFSRAPACRAQEFWREGYDDSAFDTIEVPGHIELSGTTIRWAAMCASLTWSRDCAAAASA